MATERVLGCRVSRKGAPAVSTVSSWPALSFAADLPSMPSTVKENASLAMALPVMFLTICRPAAASKSTVPVAYLLVKVLARPRRSRRACRSRRRSRRPSPWPGGRRRRCPGWRRRARGRPRARCRRRPGPLEANRPEAEVRRIRAVDLARGGRDRLAERAVGAGGHAGVRVGLWHGRRCRRPRA